MSSTRKQLQKEAWDLRSAGLNWTQIGAKLGVSRKTASRLYDEHDRDLCSNLFKHPTWTSAGPTTWSSASNVKVSIKLPANSAPKIKGNDISLERFAPEHIYGDAVVSCDWHIPLHDPNMVNSLLDQAWKRGIKKLIIAGDFFNMDSVSQYLPHQPEANLVQEREDAKEIMEACTEVFDEIVFSSGNHDFRIAKFWNHTIDYEYLIKWLLEGMDPKKLEKIKISYLDYVVYHPSDNQQIYVCHPQNFSSSPLTVARDLVQKVGMDVLTAHSHHFAQGVAKDGKHRVYDGGGLFSLNKTEYIKRTNRHHVWVPGFHIFEDGICTPYSPIYHNI